MDTKPDPSENEAIEELVVRCLDADDPAAALAELTRDSPAAFRERAERILERVCADMLPVSDGGGPLPNEIAGFRILRELGSGGMGTVYLAEQREPVRRRIALKVIRAGRGNEQLLRRFEIERQALALMSHDGIAKIHEAGTTEEGEPYFAMEYVPGLPILEYCDKSRLDTRARLELFERVCGAVQHAHQRGIIHRDLKPANILVSDAQQRAVPKIIDFGLARPTEGQLVDVTVFTQHGALVGTPAYMSPEQAEMSSAEIDTRTDIYALGVVLYELLSGALPLSEDELRGTAAEVQRRIGESEPPRPSARVSTSDASSTDAAVRRQSSVRGLCRTLRGDLDWIVMKAIERDRNRRYPTASEFAADIRRHLDGEPVLAGPPSVTYRLSKFVRKHRALVVGAAAVGVALVGGTAVSLVLYLDAREAERRAQTNLERFDLLRYRVEMDDAVADAERLYPAWPDMVPRLRAWVEARAEPLQAARPVVAAALEASGDAEVDGTARFVRETMRGVAADLDELFDPETGAAADVRERLAWAENVWERSVQRHRARWEEARQAILRADGDGASTLYASDPPLDLAPQVGLVPIGANPATGLWEFYHLRSAADSASIPVHGSGGRIELDASAGIVFVLVPGGRFVMGAQGSDRGGPNYDPQTRKHEGPPREVAVEPYFLARCELTQAQWRRLSSIPVPSSYYAGFRMPDMKAEITEAHPVENVSWTAATDMLERHALVLPTERQWARACRAAGASLPWSTGVDPGSLEGYANILDQCAATANPGWGEGEDFDDGHILHAPVGSFEPNAFGFYDMHGNVFEWCAPVGKDPRRAARGGGFNTRAAYGRSAFRWQHDPHFRNFVIGLRPARAVLASPSDK